MSLQNQEHFDKIASKYKKASDTWADIYRQIEEFVIPTIQDKDILDIGNGGYFPYNTKHANKVTVVDISPAMLDRINQPNITKVVDDAATLDKIPNESMDVVLFILCIHHICGKNPKESMEVLDKVLSSAFKKLKPGGSLIIAEPTLNGWLYHLETLLFILTRLTLKLFRVPMIFFHSSNHMKNHLALNFRIQPSQVETKALRIQNAVDPLGGSFPGLIKIPSWLCPTQYFCFHAKKVTGTSDSHQ